MPFVELHAPPDYQKLGMQSSAESVRRADQPLREDGRRLRRLAGARPRRAAESVSWRTPNRKALPNRTASVIAGEARAEPARMGVKMPSRSQA